MNTQTQETGVFRLLLTYAELPVQKGKDKFYLLNFQPRSSVLIGSLDLGYQLIYYVTLYGK